MHDAFLEDLRKRLEVLNQEGLYKNERLIAGPQQAKLQMLEGQQVLNLCANNYLGLANHRALIEAAKEGLTQFGFGMASVRFICGTQVQHKELEKRLSSFLQVDDAILYSSCFDANTGLFETLLGAEDAVISDELNHASIIDGIRLCKARRLRYKNGDMQDLTRCLQESKDCRYRLIATDGVFSMDGTVARLEEICDLAERYDALVMVDDSHAVGFMGEEGRGTPEYCGVLGRVDILTGTLGKALGGASGGYTAGRREIIQWLRQRSRPYLFSNALTPSIAAASLKMLDFLEASGGLRRKLEDNSRYFREGLQQLGFDVPDGSHPIIPVMLGSAKLAKLFAERCLEKGVYVIGFSYPVVPEGKARIRTQMSAAHNFEELNIALGVFEEVGIELGILVKS